MSIKKICKYFAIIISVISLLCFSIAAHAETEKYSIVIKFTAESRPISGSTFKIYYAMNTSGELADEFANLSIEVGDLSDSSNVNRLASTLASYAVTGIAEPVSVAESDGLGCATFTGLSDGIYLVTGASVFIDDIMYTPKPTLVDFSEILDSTVTAGVKYMITANASETNQPISRTVKKIWDDDNNEYRPESVTVQLYQNETLYDEEILSAENNWEYTWDRLSPRYDWNVVESVVPAGYTVSLVLDGQTVTVTNRGKSSSIFETNTETSTTTTDISGMSTTTTVITGISTNESTATTMTNETGTVSTNTTIATNTGTHETITSSTKTGGNSTPSGNSGTNTFGGGGGNGKQPTLPQTGQLWYPVPILFVLGLILFFVGIAFGDENEKG